MQCSPTCPWVENGIFQHNVISLHIPAHPLPGRAWYLPTPTCQPPSGKRMVSSNTMSYHFTYLPTSLWEENGIFWTTCHIPSPTCPPPSGRRMVSSNTTSYPFTYLPARIWEENGIFQHNVISCHLPAHPPLGREWYLPTRRHIPSPSSPLLM